MRRRASALAKAFASSSGGPLATHRPVAGSRTIRARTRLRDELRQLRADDLRHIAALQHRSRRPAQHPVAPPGPVQRPRSLRRIRITHADIIASEVARNPLPDTYTPEAPQPLPRIRKPLPAHRRGCRRFLRLYYLSESSSLLHGACFVSVPSGRRGPGLRVLAAELDRSVPGGVPEHAGGCSWRCVPAGDAAPGAVRPRSGGPGACRGSQDRVRETTDCLTVRGVWSVPVFPEVASVKQL
jgi:hypothetical protein